MTTSRSRVLSVAFVQPRLPPELCLTSSRVEKTLRNKYLIDLTLLKDDYQQCRQSNNQLRCPIKSNCLLELSSGVCAILITLHGRGEMQQLHDLCQCDLCGCVQLHDLCGSGVSPAQCSRKCLRHTEMCWTQVLETVANCGVPIRRPICHDRGRNCVR